MIEKIYKKCIEWASHKSSKFFLAIVSFTESSFFPIPPDIMIIPIRCFSCGGLIAHKWDEFNDKVSAGIEVSQAMDEVGLDRYCCRRMYLGHVELIHEAAPFSTYRKKS